ncbi:MAG: hypothetical protein AB7Q17_16970 [Phycisphaerae bacterium]
MRQLNFDSLPLVDVALRASLATSTKLTFEGLNEVRNALQGEFPTMTELEQFQIPPGVPGASMELGPGQVPGAVFAGRPDGVSVIVQSQLLVARWVEPPRVGTAAEPVAYPRYPALRASLNRIMEAFSQAFRFENLPVVTVNMSYTNFLRIPHDFPVLQRYFSPLVQFGAAACARRVHIVEASWQEDSGLDVRFRLRQLILTTLGQKVEGSELTTAAGRCLKSPASPMDALDGIHARLQEFFYSILSDDAQREWGLQGASDVGSVAS